MVVISCVVELVNKISDIPKLFLFTFVADRTNQISLNRMKNLKIILCAFLCTVSAIAFSQDKAGNTEYQFTKKIELKHTPVKDQYHSGTCWSFAAVSFIESELLRTGKDTIDLSEMFFVNHAYREKAERYVRLHGTSNFGPGGQAHDVFNIMKEYGLATQQEYPGLHKGESNHDHGELDAVLESFLKAVVSNKSGKLTPVWFEAYGAIIDTYLGKLPVKDAKVAKGSNSNDFTSTMGLNLDDYVEITSYTHHPFYSAFALEIPDNWSNSLYYNVPIEDLVQILNYSLENGYTVCWDGDVSDRGFSHKTSLAIIPEIQPVSSEGTEMSKWENMTEKERNDLVYNFKEPRVEKTITQEMRQEAFNNLQATDDHLMHMVGLSKDQNGKNYFITKNSWAGNSNSTGGYLNISESYVRLNTIALTVHKDAIPKNIRKKLGL